MIKLDNTAVSIEEEGQLIQLPVGKSQASTSDAVIIDNNVIAIETGEIITTAKNMFQGLYHITFYIK